MQWQCCMYAVLHGRQQLTQPLLHLQGQPVAAASAQALLQLAKQVAKLQEEVFAADAIVASAEEEVQEAKYCKNAQAEHLAILRQKEALLASIVQQVKEAYSCVRDILGPMAAFPPAQEAVQLFDADASTSAISQAWAGLAAATTTYAADADAHLSKAEDNLRKTTQARHAAHTALQSALQQLLHASVQPA